MQDSVMLKTGKTISKFRYFKKIIEKIKQKSSIPVKVFFGSAVMNEAGTLNSLNERVLDFQTLNYQAAFDESLTFDASSSILLTDGARETEFISYNSQNNFHIILPEVMNFDLAINNAEINGNRIEIELNNNTNLKKGQIILFSNSRPVYNKYIGLKKGLNQISIYINRSLIKSKFLKLIIKPLKLETNTLNNVFYIKAKPKKDKKNVYLIFSRPSFDVKFLRRVIELNGNYNITPIYPKADSFLKIPKIQKNSIVFAGDFILDKIKGLNNLINYIQNGGTVIYLYRNTKTTGIVLNKFRTIFPFKTSPKEEDTNKKINPTAKGLKYSFINFRDITNAKKIWNNMDFLKDIGLKITPDANAEVLLKKGNNPVFIKKRIGKGYIYTVLFGPLWKMDFTAIGYGLNTYYLDIFYNELIQSTFKEQVELIKITPTITSTGKSIIVKIHPSISEKVLNNRLKISLIGKGVKRNLYFSNNQGVVSSKITLEKPGRYFVIIKNKPDKKYYFYLNYPPEEIFNNSAQNNLVSLLSKNKKIKLLKMNKLNDLLKKLKNAVLINKEKKSFPLTSSIIFISFLLIIIIFSWYFNFNKKNKIN